MTWYLYGLLSTTCVSLIAKKSVRRSLFSKFQKMSSFEIISFNMTIFYMNVKAPHILLTIAYPPKETNGAITMEYIIHFIAMSSVHTRVGMTQFLF